MKTKISVELSGERVSIEFPSGERLTITPHPKGKPRAELHAHGFSGLTICPKVSNVVEVVLVDL